jgi:hypothetical protein
MRESREKPFRYRSHNEIGRILSRYTVQLQNPVNSRKNDEYMSLHFYKKRRIFVQRAGLKCGQSDQYFCKSESEQKLEDGRSVECSPSPSPSPFPSSPPSPSPMPMTNMSSCNSLASQDSCYRRDSRESRKSMNNSRQVRHEHSAPFAHCTKRITATSRGSPPR